MVRIVGPVAEYSQYIAQVGPYILGKKDHRTMAEIFDEKFKNVRKTDGIQIWRIEKMEMKEIDEDTYGTFYAGDSYIILKTIEKRAGIERRIHCWLGQDSSVDERGSAAIWSTYLDGWLGGPGQYRETQNYESKKFMGLFSKGITYKKGGVASAFRSVKPNECSNKSLYHVKGKRRPRFQEVDCEWNSFNEGDVFILDYKNWLIQWNGKSANRFEKLKACQCLVEMAARNGRQQKVIVEQGETNKDMIECLGPKPESYNQPSDDAEFENVKKAPKMYNVGSMDVVAEGAGIKQELLEPNGAYYFVDHKNIFIWKGKQSSKELRKQTFAELDAFKAKINFTGRPVIESLNVGIETASFKKLFSNWKNLDQTVGIGIGVSKTTKGIEHVDIDNSMRGNVRTQSVTENVPDEGRGELKVYRIETGNSQNELVELPGEDYGEFYEGDCYIIYYQNDRPKVEIIYCWLGQNSTIDEHTTIAHHAADLGRKSSGAPQQIRVVQGKEPVHLLKIFQHLIIHRGGPSRKTGQSERNNPAMYQSRSSVHGFNRTVEIDVSAVRLNSNDIFILIKNGTVWKWVGTGANDREVISAVEAVDAIADGCDKVIQIKEGEETPEFWEAIGGQKEYAHLSDTDVIDNAKLFVCSNASGKTRVDEVGEDFAQSDLVSDDVMILDGGNIIYVWIGSGSNDDEKNDGPEIAHRYAASCTGRRKIQTVAEGKEPVEFTGFFQGWQDGYDPSVVVEQMQHDIRQVAI